MIKFNDKDISAIKIDGKNIVTVYKSDRIVWEEIYANFITKDKLAIQCADKLIFNCKN